MDEDLYFHRKLMKHLDGLDPDEEEREAIRAEIEAERQIDVYEYSKYDDEESLNMEVNWESPE